MRYSHRFFLYAPFSAFLLIAFATMIWWWMAADALEKKLYAVNGHYVSPGVQVSFSDQHVQGFPFRLDVVFRNLRVKFLAAHGPASYQAEQFATHTLLYNSQQFILEAAGKQTLQWIDDNNKPAQLQFVPGDLHADLLLAANALNRFDIDIVGLNLPKFGAARAQFHFRHDPQSDAFDVAISLDDLRLHTGEPQALGNRILHGDITGRIGQAHLLQPILQGTSPWRRYAENWRKAGTATVDSFNLTWGKLTIKGSNGNFALDSAHRPKGLLRVSVTGYDALVRDTIGDLPKQYQGYGFALYGFLIATHGMNTQIPTTLAVKDGVAYLGSVPATTLYPLY